MIDLHSIVVSSVVPVKVRPAAVYVPQCTVVTDAAVFEVSDTDMILAAAGTGTGVVDNIGQSQVTLFHLGRALTMGPAKINNLPSACDLIVYNDNELIVAELTESKPRSIVGVPGAPYPGKMEKAKIQLRSTISIIDTIGDGICQQKKTAIFFFKLRNPENEIAARSVKAFSMRPTLRMVTVYTDNACPGWEFRNHPYPIAYPIS